MPLRESERPQPVLASIGRVLPDYAEVSANPRARSAVLRVAERTAVALPAAGGAAFVKSRSPVAPARRPSVRAPRAHAVAFA
jgi:16S rRNA (cytosine1402-N4)-methyltransferase